MRINTQFPVAVHILAVIGLRENSLSTSELLAKSVNTNPVVVRRIVGLLKKAGLVEVRAGVGGSRLTRPPEDVTLLDVYDAVKPPEKAALFDLHPHPNPQCPVGGNIHEVLSAPLMDAQKALEGRLADYTLKDVIEPIVERMRSDRDSRPGLSRVD